MAHHFRGTGGDGTARTGAAGEVRLAARRDRERMILATGSITSPVGILTLVAADDGLVAVLWEDDDPARVRLGSRSPCANHPILVRTAAELREYFAGTRRVFTVPLAIVGTDFQQAVWAALLAIPYGETRSYGEIARAIGHPSAARAVGAANGRNPISIIAPCHRVIGSTGRLTGFAGGLAVKSRLLNFERRAIVDRRGGQAMPRPMPV